MNTSTSHRQEIAALIATIVEILNDATISMDYYFSGPSLLPDEVSQCCRKALDVYMNDRIK